MSEAACSVNKPARRSLISFGWMKEFWPYRELFFFLAWRDIKIRYRQTALGAIWAVLQPLMTALVFTVLFGRVARMPSDGMPYTLFSYTALVGWIYFSGALASASGSLVGNAELIRKVYFPRAIVTGASVLAGLVDMTVGIVILGVMMVHYRIHPRLALLLWPAVILELVVLAFSIGIIFAALNVKYRDVKHALPFVTQLWLFLSPIIYPVSMIPRRFRMLLALNPLTGIIGALRGSLAPGRHVDWHLLGISACVTAVLFFVGIIYFRNTERAFADVI
jgi:lipopolysaccharide transport system permease protein